MHIVKADPATAQAQAQKALDPANGGVLTTNADNAGISGGGTHNPLQVITDSWTDIALGAPIESYLVGYNDPRLPVYASPAKDPRFAGQYKGIRIGALMTAKPGYNGYALLNSSTIVKSTSPMMMMTAAEVWFLKAEAALRGWTGAGDAQTNYTTGIQTSMAQWGVSGSTYINDNTSLPIAYVDPGNAANNSPAVSTITIQWDGGAANEQKLERIITQKWIAMFPEGQEAWTEYRRTGYPKLFPVVNNNSNGTVDTKIQIRRLAFPQNEYSTNGAEIAKAVQLLNGPDNGGTRLWWDVNKPNF
ncbi:SusD/RagB family nutrient-binding outer membrane lipoprotein [Pedobacter sp. NJ-S-72]